MNIHQLIIKLLDKNIWIFIN